MKNDIFKTSKHMYPYLNPSLPLIERIDDLISRMTLDEKISMIPTRQGEVERLGIKAYNVGGEAAHGVVSNLGTATVFPQPQGLSCTWNSKLMKEIGGIIGDEARVYYKKNNEEGGLTLWAPTIDMERDPRWGRTEEAYGEDPCLTGKLSAELIKGMQGNHEFYLKMVPAPKHFYGNNNEEGRIFCSSSIDPRNKHEYYLKAFEKAFTVGKAFSMMTAYNEINGRPCLVNHEVKDIVKDKWGCDGFIVCDGGDMSQTVEYHKYYKTHAETIANALKNGVDVMTDDRELVISATKEAIDMGLLSENDLNNSLKNIFKVRFKLGQFDPQEINPYESIPESILNCENHKKVAKKAAEEAIVLLKNNNSFLPLKKENLKKVSVIGPLADVVYRDWYTGRHEYKITPLEGIIDKLGREKVSYCSGNDIVKIKNIDSGKTLKVDNASKNLMFGNESSKENEKFELSDWGWDSCTLRSISEDKYLTTNDKDITANADEVFGWFVREVFKVKECKNNNVSINSWNNSNLYLDQDSYLKVNDMQDKVNNSLEDHNRLNLQDKLKIEKILDGKSEAVKAAENSDVAMVFVGNNPVINGKEEIDREDITLAKAQEELVKAVYESNPNTIVVVVGSYPFAINFIDENIPAILYTAHGCQELGSAISNVLFGDYSPSGRLSMTWYKDLKQLPPINDYDIIKGNRTYMYFDRDPLYPFGHGLTYTSFEYKDLQFSSEEIDEFGQITISFNVENTGQFDSDEVVQLYVKSNNSKVKRPFKELKDFKRLTVKKGESKKVELVLKSEDLAFWDVRSNDFLLEEGFYTIMIGSSSKDIRLEKTIKVNGSCLKNRECRKEIFAENYDDYNNIIIQEWQPGEDCVAAISDESYLRFNDIEFTSEISKCEILISNNDIAIELFLDSIENSAIASYRYLKSADSDWCTKVCFEIKPVVGVHDLYIKLNKGIKLRSFRVI
ncbi:glycoside hydrolase family 3 protein [Clostridium folliculivorans]|uniref:Glucan 1,4-alpha-glucosidase n=1 Tax=Clostridium folliculivorans TaxID=2886038 RepID=A0A9W6D9N9_9CLOT|nr:glycoside hydrolase family 3 protein [Clostridium folliculivorans]GKU24525.1 glucan 1,4-alpha-glucosidase [Clostridium folliculivorans]GKU30623.1 glucan 1,4-alpha-glucosidase [Clostridium folliculivorans]